MSNILLLPQRGPTLSWFDMVSPHPHEMPAFLRAYVGRGQEWRTPKRLWEDLWRLKRGDEGLQMMLGKRQIKFIKNQRGFIAMTVVYQEDTGTQPLLTNITNSTSQVAPTAARQQYAYDSDGSMEQDVDATSEASIVYADLTTQTDDANNHSSEWWPDQPDVNEGLNWDIRYLNESTIGTNFFTHLLADNTGTNRTTATWYLLDTVSNDHVNASHDGGIGCNRTNGTAKNPNTGTSTLTVDVEIRATGSGVAVASHSYDLDCVGT